MRFDDMTPAPDLSTLFQIARRVFVITGAGVSAESGIPTFRGAEGVWKKFNPMELASLEGFQRNPARCWEWYIERRQTARAASPNSAHQALARLECQVAARGGEMMVVTQNIDGLHQRAGSQRVVEIDPGGRADPADRDDRERHVALQFGRGARVVILLERAQPTQVAAPGGGQPQPLNPARDARQERIDPHRHLDRAGAAKDVHRPFHRAVTHFDGVSAGGVEREDRRGRGEKIDRSGACWRR